MKNIINAIINLIENHKVDLVRHYSSVNRANNMGDALEEYVKDLYAGTIDETDESIRIHKISETFSYLGNASNPPDSMLRGGGDAIEVKKLQGMGDLALNSSHPKRKLRIDNPKINQHCKTCEEWYERDMQYIVGICTAQKIKSLCIIYGEEYCADIEIYSNAENAVKLGLRNIEDMEFSETNELGRFNRIDPLGITNMRVRGMWTISNPFKVFNYIYNMDSEKEFNFMALINNNKYETLSNRNELENLVGVIPNLKIEDVEVKEPNNPAQLKKCKLITFKL